MPVAGRRPESGVRIELERPRGDTPPFRYAGAVHLPDASHDVRVVVEEDGRVEVSLAPGPVGADAAVPPDLSEKVRLIVRTVTKQAKADEVAPPLRIVRWRGEK